MWQRILLVLFCVVLAGVVVRAWVLEGLIMPVRIIGPSMAETFYGPHFELTCEDCGFPFAFDATTPPLPQTAICPNCGYRENETKAEPLYGGDRLLIDKMTYQLRRPNRWEAILFRNSSLQRGVCIKRVVGFPGEIVEIRDGDVFVDRVREKKTWNDLRPMALVIHDARHRSRDVALPRRWRSAKPTNGWQSVAEGFAYRPDQRLSHAVAGLSEQESCSKLDWLRYHHCQLRVGSHFKEGALSDNYGYNQTLSRQLNDIEDMYLIATVEARGDGVLAVRVPAGGKMFLLRMDTTSRRGTLFCGNKSVGAFVWQAGQLDSPTTLEVATLDKQFLVAMDGVSCLSFDYEQPLRQADGERTKDPGSPQRTDDDLLAIGACGLEVELKDLRLLRDVYYTQGPPPATGTDMKMYPLGADEFFVLGDNSPVSLDSRQGRPDGVVKEADLLGKPWRWR